MRGNQMDAVPWRPSIGVLQIKQLNALAGTATSCLGRKLERDGRGTSAVFERFSSLDIDRRRGWIYAVDGAFIVIFGVIASRIAKQLAIVPDIAVFPPGLCPIVGAYAEHIGEVDTLYDCWANRAEHGSMCTAEHVVVDDLTGDIVVSIQNSESNMRIIRWDYNNEKWSVWKYSDQILRPVSALTSDGSGGVFFLEPCEMDQCEEKEKEKQRLWAKMKERNVGSPEFSFIRHISSKGSIEPRGRIRNGLSFDQNYSPYATIPHQTTMVRGLKAGDVIVLTVPYIRLRALPITIRPPTYTSHLLRPHTSAIRCCQLCIISTACAVDADTIFYAHASSICVVKPSTGKSYILLTTNWDTTLATLAFMPSDRDTRDGDILGYLWITTGPFATVSRSPGIFCVPISSTLWKENVPQKLRGQRQRT